MYCLIKVQPYVEHFIYLLEFDRAQRFWSVREEMHSTRPQNKQTQHDPESLRGPRAYKCPRLFCVDHVTVISKRTWTRVSNCIIQMYICIFNKNFWTLFNLIIDLIWPFFSAKLGYEVIFYVFYATPIPKKLECEKKNRIEWFANLIFNFQ